MLEIEDKIRGYVSGMELFWAGGDGTEQNKVTSRFGAWLKDGEKGRNPTSG